MIVLNGLGRAQIENRPPVRLPSLAFETKDSRCRPKVAHGICCFQSPPSAFFHLDGDGDKGVQFAGGPISGIDHVIFEFAIYPTGGIMAVGRHAKLDKLHFQPLALTMKIATCLSQPSPTKSSTDREPDPYQKCQEEYGSDDDPP